MVTQFVICFIIQECMMKQTFLHLSKCFHSLKYFLTFLTKCQHLSSLLEGLNPVSKISITLLIAASFRCSKAQSILLNSCISLSSLAFSSVAFSDKTILSAKGISSFSTNTAYVNAFITFGKISAGLRDNPSASLLELPVL